MGQWPVPSSTDHLPQPARDQISLVLKGWVVGPSGHASRVVRFSGKGGGGVVGVVVASGSVSEGVGAVGYVVGLRDEAAAGASRWGNRCWCSGGRRLLVWRP